ncbi:glycosyltransferase family 2 protein [Alteromonas lipolytica]|uniref:Rhamnosyltransferase n=1 Tax=Alteromonas lipolytica TaxID=1856405 RepID=A0A1E8F9J3_9ALTE|nr:glycosyltransferase family 2 protein [Alteromonas lipolytica]OFI32584.1 hypothetical protein BFC17_05370 [Alteromonas lipolytica]GGF74908.1 rhamnosyltransferase [Alteromonas lipolytica]
MKFVAIIILYHPEQDVLLGNIAHLQDAGWGVIIIDNSPQSCQGKLSSVIEYRHFPTNIGIAAAQNRGLEVAVSLQYDYAMLLDQDSRLSVAFLNAVSARSVTAHQLFPDMAAYGPTIISEFNNKAVKARIQRPESCDNGFMACRQIIASGKVIPLSVLQITGDMEEALFIDGVDHEWCWRAAQRGLRIIGDTQTHLLHRQGEDRKKILGITFKVGSPIRLYYQYRNILLLSRRGYVPRYWKLRNCLALPLRWIINGWCLDNKALRRKYMHKGLLDGINERAGPYQPGKQV